MKNILQPLLLLFIPFMAISSTINYPVSAIPKNLLTNADAVIRKYSVEKEITSTSVITHESFVVTIFNKNAQELGYFYEGYDKQSKVTGYKMILYNADGLPIDASKNSDFVDVKAFDGFSLFDDNRVIYNRAYYAKYPYTIEYQFTRKESQTLLLGSWAPCHYRTSVEDAELTVNTNDSNLFKYQERNLTTPILFTEHKGNYGYQWIIKNFEAIDNEPLMPDYRDVFPMVYLAPKQFIFDGYPGNLNSWQNFGSWLWNLNKDRDELPASTTDKVTQLTAQAKTDEEKIRILYQYLQDNTRYVSISLGIGGFQPFDASTVDDTKYGDCKALSNYMKALLKAAQINSIYAVVRGERYASDIRQCFPSLQMNHAILCVPNQEDTIWLECTSQRNPFGYMGSFTGDRHALLVTENGGKMVKIPGYQQELNQQFRQAKGVLDNQGHLDLTSVTNYKALQFENVEGYFYRSAKEQKEELYKALNIPNLTIESFNFSLQNKPIPEAECDLQLNINKYASISGERLLFPLNALNKQTRLLKKIPERKYPVMIRSNYVDSDTIEYKLPEGYSIEYLPEPIELSTPFGNYSAGIIQTDSSLVYYRNVTMNKGTFAPETYEDVREFYRKMVKSDEQKVVLKKL